jgi:type II secretory pathway pseudopilin PulG
MRSRSQRGSSLLVSLLVITILTVIGAAMVRFAAREQAGALATSRHDTLVNCARAAVRVLQSQYGLGVWPNQPLDMTIGDVRLVGGHIDQVPTALNVEITQVVPLRRGSFGGMQNMVGDLTNVIMGFGQTPGPKKVTAHCQTGDQSGPTTGRQMEVEFDVLTGL